MKPITLSGRRLAAHRFFFACLLVAALTTLFTFPAFADGCFVFKWDKNIDINEPTQKAIILHHAGREDLLLQVRYEGPLEEFGWLIPVPSLPSVSKGAMDAFYELSELTQRKFAGGDEMPMMSMSTRGRGEESVKVIEVKTVGAYEVAILSASDAGGLERWLKAHGYSIPNGRTDIVDEYIRNGWYFVAARIQLNQGTGFKLVSSPGDSRGNARNQAAIRKKLASGELHPLLISFDTPKCVFPLKISAVGGKPSEVSLYVLSETPLLNKFVLDEAAKKMGVRYGQWTRDKLKYESALQQVRENQRVLSLSFQLTPALRHPDGSIRTRPDLHRKWTVEDLQALVRESPSRPPPVSIEDNFNVSGGDLVRCLRVEPGQITKTIRSMPRLKDRSWYLTKFARTFSPQEMHDLELEPAAPLVSELLSHPIGRAAAATLAQLGSSGTSSLIVACRSTNAMQRMNAVFGLQHIRHRGVVEPLLDLLKDETPQVRLYAARAAVGNWDERLRKPLEELFRDLHQEIRSESVACLSAHESTERTSAYLKMLSDPDSNVCLSALWMLLRLNPDAIPPEPLVRMLKDRDSAEQYLALHMLWKLNRDLVPRSELLPILSRAWMEDIYVSIKLIEGNGRVQAALPEPFATEREQEDRKRWLTSDEVTALATNRLGEARLAALRLLERNADAKAVELTIPLLRDRNLVVRECAFSVMKNITRQDLPDDASEWESWWRTQQTGRTDAPRQEN